MLRHGFDFGLGEANKTVDERLLARVERVHFFLNQDGFVCVSFSAALLFV